jgi:hypothetical protein
LHGATLSIWQWVMSTSADVPAIATPAPGFEMMAS